MARFIRATHRAALPRHYLCGKCNAFGTTVVAAVGSARKRVWFSEDAAADGAHDLAAAELQADADRIVGLIHCPSCGHRNQSALASVWYWFAEGVVAFLAAAFLGIAAHGASDSLVVSLIVCAVVFGGMLWVSDERRRRRAAASAPVVLMESTEPAPKPAPAPARRGPVAVDATPFRAPPAPPPIAVIAPVRATTVPVAKNDDAAAPKLLV